MNNLHKRRLWILIFFSVGILLAVSLIFYALKQNINVFVTPSEIKEVAANKAFRLGGMVKQKSLQRDKNSLAVSFVVTDFKKDILVKYTGILPDLFREGKGVIAEGRMNDKQIFTATNILAKHDENYMPKKISQSLEVKQNV